MYDKFDKYRTVALVLCNGVSDFRMTLAARGLERAGYTVDVLKEVHSWQLNAYAAWVMLRPGYEMLGMADILASVDKPVVIDLDDDFYSIPQDNPAWIYSGAGAMNGLYHKRLRKTLSDQRVRVTYASAVLAERYENPGAVLMNPWDDENKRWGLKMHTHPDCVTFGWAGTPTHRKDFEIVFPALERLMNEDARVRVMIGADMDIYAKFSAFGPTRKTFIPAVPFDVYPIFTQNCDVWIAPLEDTFFNQAKSDIKIVDAVAGRVPWLASPLPQYQAWAEAGQASGRIVANDQWYTELAALVDSPLVRRSMAGRGEVLAQTRTATAYGAQWAAFMQGVIG